VPLRQPNTEHQHQTLYAEPRIYHKASVCFADVIWSRRAHFSWKPVPSRSSFRKTCAPNDLKAPLWSFEIPVSTNLASLSTNPHTICTLDDMVEVSDTPHHIRGC
jgi:hypothetical protein